MESFEATNAAVCGGKGSSVLVAKMSHGGVALYDSLTGRLVQWIMMSSGTPMSAQVDGDDVSVTFADGRRSVYDATNGGLRR
jgi:hypothetical protein